jgi:hypothetical protein
MKALKCLPRLSLVLALFLGACASAPATPTPAAPGTATPVAATPSVAKTILTYVASAGIGNIAVRVSFPKTPRYAPSAGIVVLVPPILTEAAGFQSSPDVTGLGLIQVSFLWPGQTDRATHTRSDGTFDHGGTNSIQALRDVLRFATGIIQDQDGHYINNLALVTALPSEVGLYGYGDAGMAALNVLALYGDQLQNVTYLVGYENPTGDTTANLELGYWESNGQPVFNPTYTYPQNYAPNTLKLNFTTLRWEAAYKNSQTGALGRPYLDLDGTGAVSSGDFIFNDQVPTEGGKRYYSTALTQALFNQGDLNTSDWPADLATPQEAAQFWQFRQASTRYLQIGNLMYSLHVMLLFAVDDHAQVSADKPHIHQLFQGLRYQAARPESALGLWVRLNPDRAYISSLIPGANLDFPDNPANTQPDDWTQIGRYAVPDLADGANLVSLAGIAEMADRTHYATWDLNLGQVLNRP